MSFTIRQLLLASTLLVAATASAQLGNDDCASCHPDEVAAWRTSRHAKALASGNTHAASCLSCHGADPHKIVPIARKSIPQTCGRCHGQKFVMESSGVSTSPAFSYQQSVHGRAIANGSDKAAVCSDCHNAHDILAPNDQKSSINKFNIPKTCGKCHTAISAEYTRSIHGKAIARGNDKAPVCTD